MKKEVSALIAKEDSSWDSSVLQFQMRFEISTCDNSISDSLQRTVSESCNWLNLGPETNPSGMHDKSASAVDLWCSACCVLQQQHTLGWLQCLENATWASTLPLAVFALRCPPYWLGQLSLLYIINSVLLLWASQSWSVPLELHWAVGKLSWGQPLLNHDVSLGFC